MSDSQPTRFFPRPFLWIGIVVWIALTVFACNGELFNSDYETVVIIFGIVMLSLVAAILTAWVMLMLTLLFNWLVTARREMFRKQLSEWTWSFALLTIFGVLSLFIDS